LSSINGGKVNTYTFTKALAETFIETRGRANLPPSVGTAIIRPSVVGNSYREPYPGWGDVVHGGIGTVLAVANGSWRNSWSSEDDDLVYGVPVDQCVNLIIAAGWDVGATRQQRAGITAADR
jgi:fatty acyl-CoA reductase